LPCFACDATQREPGGGCLRCGLPALFPAALFGGEGFAFPPLGAAFVIFWGEGLAFPPEGGLGFGAVAFGFGLGIFRVRPVAGAEALAGLATLLLGFGTAWG